MVEPREAITEQGIIYPDFLGTWGQAGPWSLRNLNSPACLPAGKARGLPSRSSRHISRFRPYDRMPSRERGTLMTSMMRRGADRRLSMSLGQDICRVNNEGQPAHIAHGQQSIHQMNPTMVVQPQQGSGLTVQQPSPVNFVPPGQQPAQNLPHLETSTQQQITLALPLQQGLPRQPPRMGMTPEPSRWSMEAAQMSFGRDEPILASLVEEMAKR
ncbi:hypothetical protein AAF712_013178 [Marasmius tenuissimus]|uniref:Uncharacterized protein n=1 Tax=Marasmius tenuissimus TaxID=585030 RepID=A0ABR2ZFD5_9AGAR